MDTDRGKNVSWGTVLVIAGIVFLVLALIMRAPVIYFIAAPLLVAGLAMQYVASRRGGVP